MSQWIQTVKNKVWFLALLIMWCQGSFAFLRSVIHMNVSVITWYGVQLNCFGRFHSLFGQKLGTNNSFLLLFWGQQDNEIQHIYSSCIPQIRHICQHQYCKMYILDIVFFLQVFLGVIYQSPSFTWQMFKQQLQP